MMNIATDLDRKLRKQQLSEEDKIKEKEHEERKKNHNFIQMYPRGFRRIRNLMKEYPLAAEIYIFLGEHIDEHGAVVASQQLMAEELDVSIRSVRRATKWLDERDIIVRIKLGPGSIYAYCFSPEEIWKSWNTSKDYASFNTKTLARKVDNGDIKRRISALLKGESSFQEKDEEDENQLTLDL